jgi:hypothetical protein
MYLVKFSSPKRPSPNYEAQARPEPNPNQIWAQPEPDPSTTRALKIRPNPPIVCCAFFATWELLMTQLRRVKILACEQFLKQPYTPPGFDLTTHKHQSPGTVPLDHAVRWWWWLASKKLFLFKKFMKIVSYAHLVVNSFCGSLTGLPDFSLYKICTKMGKIYQITTTCTKWS